MKVKDMTTDDNVSEEKAILAIVDMVSYHEVFGETEIERRYDYSKQYEPMYLTPQRINEFIDNGVNLKFE